MTLVPATLRTLSAPSPCNHFMFLVAMSAMPSILLLTHLIEILLHHVRLRFGMCFGFFVTSVNPPVSIRTVIMLQIIPMHLMVWFIASSSIHCFNLQDATMKVRKRKEHEKVTDSMSLSEVIGAFIIVSGMLSVWVVFDCLECLHHLELLGVPSILLHSEFALGNPLAFGWIVLAPLASTLSTS
jgi:hypothetical protein